MADRTIRGVAREAGAWRIVQGCFALIGLLAMIYSVVWFGFGAIVETQEQRAEVVSDG